MLQPVTGGLIAKVSEPSLFKDGRLTGLGMPSFPVEEGGCLGRVRINIPPECEEMRDLVELAELLLLPLEAPT